MNPTSHREDDHETVTHPAFGSIVLTQTQGGSSVLFGSHVDHHLGRIHIQIKRASLMRTLGHDFLQTHETIVALEMSHAQFVSFVTGVGKGEGTPVTILDCPDTAAVSVPPIDEIQTRVQMAEQNIRVAAERASARVAEISGKLADLIATGKAPLKELREISRELRIAAEGIPNNMAYATHVAEEALEEATNAAKIEVEAFVDATAKRLGLESIRTLTAITHTEKTHE